MSVDSKKIRRGLDMMEKDRDRIAMEQREAAVSISNLRSEALPASFIKLIVIFNCNIYI